MSRSGAALKSFIKSIVVLFVLAVAVVVGGAYVIPPVARVERAIHIAAPPAAVYAIVSDLRRYPEWSPWQELDPATAYAFEGAENGVGQKLTWSSTNPQVGKGTQTIVALDPDRAVRMELDVGPMGKAQSELVLSPVDTGTVVVWRFEKPVEGVLERWMSLMFDRTVGADYVRGLSLLKKRAEPPATGN